jgi:hypothetical protein
MVVLLIGIGLTQPISNTFAQNPALDEIGGASDANNNGKIDDDEILDAIRRWILGETVPGTNRTIGDDVMLDLIRVWVTGETITTPPVSTTVLLDTSDCNFSDFSDIDGDSVRVGDFSTIFEDTPFKDSLAHEAFKVDGDDPCGLIFTTGAVADLNLDVWVHSQIVINIPVGGGIMKTWQQRSATWQEPTNVPANRRVWANNIVRVLNNPNLSDSDKQVLLKKIEAKGDDYKALVDSTGFMPGGMEHQEFRLDPGIRRVVIEFRFHLILFSAAAEMISDLRVEFGGAASSNDVLDISSEAGSEADAHIRFEYVDQPVVESTPLVDLSDCDLSDFDNKDGGMVRIGRFESVFRDTPFEDSFAEEAFKGSNADVCGLIFSTGMIDGEDLGYWVHSKITITDIDPGGFKYIWWERGATWEEPKPPNSPKLIDPKTVPSSVRRWAANINRIQQNTSLSEADRTSALGQIAQKGSKYERLVKMVEDEEVTDNTGFMEPKHEGSVIFVPPSVNTIVIEFVFHLTAFSSAAEIIANFRVDSSQQMPSDVSPSEVFTLEAESGHEGVVQIQFEFVDEPGSEEPHAIFDYEMTENGIQFMGEESFDSDGEIVQWNWDFGDGSSTSGQNLSSPLHQYEEMGGYEVTLTVWDNDGLSDSTTMKVIYGEEEEGATGSAPEIKSISVPESIVVGEGASVNVFFSDPDADLVEAHFEDSQGNDIGIINPGQFGIMDGSFPFVQPCNNVGEFENFITLVDQQGNKSEPMGYKVNCVAA